MKSVEIKKDDTSEQDIEEKGRRFFAPRCSKGQAFIEYLLVLVLIIVAIFVLLNLSGLQQILGEAIAYIRGELSGGPPGS